VNVSVQVSRRAVLAGLLPLALAGADAPAAAAGPWPGETRVVRGGRSLVLVHAPRHRRTPAMGPAGSDDPAAGRDTPDDLARRADAAAERVQAVLGGAAVTAVVLVPATAAEAARLVGAAALDGLAAVADGGRVIVVPDAFDRLTPVGRDVVLTHELTHVAAGTGGLPVWLYEGFADYVAYRDAGLPVPVAAAELAAEVRSGRAPHELPGDAAFAPGAARLAAAYQEAWLACRFLAERFGEARLVRLYRDARDVGAGRALAWLGLAPGTLTARWRAYVREQLA
jgi:hypothetical protein